MQTKKARRVFLTLALSLGVAGMILPKTTVYAEGKKFDTSNIPEELIFKDANGNYIDLGGIEITVGDWWSPENCRDSADHSMGEGYLDWAEQTYHFTIKSSPIGDWDNIDQQFIDYVYSGGDDKNYIYTLHDTPEFTKAVFQGICYDLSKLDCLDFSQKKFKENKISDQFSIGHEIYAMYSGPSEPRGGLYFNKKILTDAGIDPDSLYDLQANGEWTWAKFEEILSKVHRDVDGDGDLDIAGYCGNNGNLPIAAIASNNTSLIGQDETHHYVYNLKDPAVSEALNYAADLSHNYFLYDSIENMNKDARGEEITDPHDWEYYKTGFVNGEAAFMIEDSWAITGEEFLADANGKYGYLCFPKGPKASEYANVWSNNFLVIPACYDDERAWKIAFAWNLYTNYPNDDTWKEDYRTGFGDDTRAIDETLTIMKNTGVVSYHSLIPGIDVGDDLTWRFADEEGVDAIINRIDAKWSKAVAKANANVDKKLATQTFEDVKFGDWYVKAVQFVMDNEIMNGKGKKTKTSAQEIFDPQTPLTRAEFVTVLYNKEKKPEAPTEVAFEDVKNGEWYAQAVAWAYANGIVSGYGENEFGVDDKISREQLAQMLFNYANYRNYDTSVTDAQKDLSRFADPDLIDDWAFNAMTWVTTKGIMNGDTAEKPHLNPLGEAKRSECASLVQKFMEVLGEETAK